MKKYLPLISLFSFFLLFLLVIVFALIAPGHYTWDVATIVRQPVILNILFIFSLIFNIVCVLLSFLTSLQVCISMLVKRIFSVELLLRIFYNLCPLIFLFFLAGLDAKIVINYITSPFYMLKQLL